MQMPLSPTMIYASGVVRPELIGLSDFAFMHQPGMGNKPCWTWMADNGRYKDRTSLERWWSWLIRLRQYAPSCLFAVAPDVFIPEEMRGDADATWALSLPYFDAIRALGYPAALVAQDGFEDTRPDWRRFDALFLGGSTTWKLSHHATAAIGEANDCGKWTHMGRVNSQRRFTIAYKMGCKSVDGTYLRWHNTIQNNIIDIRRWAATTNGQLLLAC